MKTKTILVLIILFMTLALQANATLVRGVRYYSESEKTRVRVLLKKTTQYKTQLDLENNISISISDSELEGSNRSFSVEDGLVKAIALKEMNNNVEIKISLEKPASFNAFPLDSPSRIVIDVTPVAKATTPEVAAISTSKSISTPKKVENKTLSITNNNVKTTKSIDTKVLPDNDKNTNDDDAEGVLSSTFGFGNIKPMFLDLSYTFIQIGFDIVILVFLVYIISKVKTVLNFARFVKKRGRILKKDKAFADMLIELENGFTQETDKQSKKREQVSKEKNNDYENRKKIKKDRTTEQIPASKQYEKVYEMAQRGIDPILISQKSNIPIGEVNLILDLIKVRKVGSTSS